MSLLFLCLNGIRDNGRRKGYTHIEHEAGGAERLDIPASNAGLIDELY